MKSAPSQMVMRAFNRVPQIYGPDGERNLAAESELWITLNRAVYDTFVAFALRAARSGRKLGAKAIAERVRWEVQIERRAEGDYHVNNNYVAYMARKAMDEHGELTGYFETRSARGDRDPWASND